MANGNKAQRPRLTSPTVADASPLADQPPIKVGEELGPLVCSSCRTTFDRSKVDTRSCWLCDRRDFVNPTEVELQRQKKLAEKRELCCPNPDCERLPELMPNAEKYCGGCGVALEKAAVELWFRKCVEPVARQEPSRLTAGRAEFVDAAWRLQITKEAAEAKLDDYLASPDFERAQAAARRSASGEESAPTPSPSGSSVGHPTQETFTGITGTHRDSPAVENYYTHWQRERDWQRKAFLVKCSVAVICFLIVVALILLAGRRGPVMKPDSGGATPPPATPTPLPTPSPPLMIEVSGGEFMMGRDTAEGGDRYESPSHLVRVKPFLMDVYEVTREEYQKCVEAGKCAKPSIWKGDSYPAGTGRLPVTGVTWEDANNYALWASKRLPTEEEWEFAARGSDGRLYPWGQKWIPGQANLGGSNLREVGSYKASSPFQLFDMLGNAQEWTRSEWKKYPDKTTYLSMSAAPESLRVIRGGSYKDAPRSVTATYRNALRMSTEESYEETGFRCVRELGPEECCR